MERVPTFIFILGLAFFLSVGDLFASPIDLMDVRAIKLITKSLGGDIGVKALGASGFLIQILVRVLQSKGADRFFQKQKPWVRLSLVSALTFAITPLGLMSLGGLSLAGALFHTATLNAFMVFLDQVIKKAPGNQHDTTSRK